MGKRYNTLDMGKFLAFLDDLGQEVLMVPDPNNCYNKLLFGKQYVSPSLCKIVGWVITAEDERTFGKIPTGRLAGLYTLDDKQLKLFNKLPKESIALLRAFPKEYMSECATYWDMMTGINARINLEICRQCEARYGNTIVGDASALYDSSTCGALPNGLNSNLKSRTTCRSFYFGHSLEEFTEMLILVDADPFTNRIGQNRCGDEPFEIQSSRGGLEETERLISYLTDANWVKKYAENMLDDAKTGPVLMRWFQEIQDMRAKFTELLTVPRDLPEQRLREIVLAVPEEYRHPKQHGKKPTPITIYYTDSAFPQKGIISQDVYADRIPYAVYLTEEEIPTVMRKVNIVKDVSMIVAKRIEAVLDGDKVLWEKGKPTA